MNEFQDASDVYDWMRSIASADPETIRSGFAIPIHFFAADYITKGAYTKTIGTASIPFYMNDPRLKEFLGDIETHMGIAAGTLALALMENPNSINGIAAQYMEIYYDVIAGYVAFLAIDDATMQAGTTLGDLLFDGADVSLTGDGLKRALGYLPPSEVARIKRLCGEDFSITPEVSTKFNGVFTVMSPLILDLDGDGVETTGVGDSTAWFDFNGDGRRELTGWAAPDDGFLVFDRNGDGLINNGSELFGDNTVRYDGQGLCANGYEALAQEDTNGDGIVNHLDDNWHNLRIWRDLNQDGISQESELFTLDELGIAGLEVKYEEGAHPRSLQRAVTFSPLPHKSMHCKGSWILT